MSVDYYGSSNTMSPWYYLIFPIDAWSKHYEQDYLIFQEQKQHELFPIMVFLLPAIVLLSGLSLSLGFWGNLFFYATEAILLGLISMWYVKLPNGGFAIELMLNFWLSMMFNAVCFSVFLFLIGIFF